MVKRNKERSYFIERWPKKDKSNKKYVLEVMEYRGLQLQHVSKELKDDIDVVSIAVENEPSAFRYASPRIRSIKKLAYSAVREDPDNFQFVSRNLRADLDLFRIIINEKRDRIYVNDFDGFEFYCYMKNPYRLLAIGEEWNYIELFQYVSIDWSRNKELLLSMIEKYNGSGMWLRYLPYYQNDKEFVIKAVESTPKALYFASEDIHNDVEFITSLIKQHPACYLFVSEEIRNDKNLILEILPNVKIWSKIPPELKKDYDIIKMTTEFWLNQAFMDDILAFSELLPDEYFVFVSKTKQVNKCSDNFFKHFPSRILKNKQVMVDVIEYSEEAFTCCSPKLLKDKEFVMNCIEKT